MIQILTGDCMEILPTLDDGSVQCCVTSPPYWGLRDYGTAGQLGLEPTPAEYLAKMVAVFREVWRVMRDDGTLWVNMGDSYCSTAPGTMGDPLRQTGILAGVSERRANGSKKFRPKTPSGLKPKDLCGIPWRLAFALQADGWYLRSDIIWHKPNPMPESVTDRPTKSHEYIFLLSKQQRYFYDADAIREKAEPDTARKNPNGFPVMDNQKMGSLGSGVKNNISFRSSKTEVLPYRNKRTVWTVATQPYAEAHFATFPEDLIKPCIMAGSRVGDTVLDPFGGSGTTGKVAMELGRKAILIELNPAYAELATKRTNVTCGML